MPDIISIAHMLPANASSRNRETRETRAIRYLVVHRDGMDVPGQTPYDPLARYVMQAGKHMRRNWNSSETGPRVRGFGLMWHYRVSADGRIWRTQPEELVTWHTRGANYNGLAICCDLGKYQQPAAAQLAGLRALLDWLCNERPDIPAGRSDVWAHSELQRSPYDRRCPGALLPWVRAYREGLLP